MEIEKIVNICLKNECINCPIYEDELEECMLEHIPLTWDLEEIERRLKNYGEKEADRS